MCLALYLASAKTLPLIEYPSYSESVFNSSEWPRVAQRFHTSALQEKQVAVRKHFSLPNVVFAGSYEGCSCGFNYGREYPDDEDDKDHLQAARESVEELVAYVRSNDVTELYACWFDDESLLQESQRAVTTEELASPTFVFKLNELLRVVMPPNPAFNTDLGVAARPSAG